VRLSTTWAKLTVAERGVGLADEGCRRSIARCQRRAPYRPEMHQQLRPTAFRIITLRL